ncbi:MAG: ATP-dependent helicase HrpB [Cyanobacteriota bacterium]|nr:ATP-dependent helicase HrpB [Cyanobacteriota bacterium]
MGSPQQPLPIDGSLAAIVKAAAVPGATVLLQAPPGAGKTTRVPLSLLASLGQQGTVVMLEPRRLAASAAARRLAQELGEPVGQRVGYAVRHESRRSAATRLEVLTAGLFLRRLQADPALAGVTAVILDEFHERRADSDLALTLLREARSVLCPALRLVVMSATLDLEPLAASLPGAVVIHSPGRSHPVAVSHLPARPGEPLEQHVLRALETAWRPDSATTALVFLPGLAEIRACQRRIEASSWGEGVDCRPLHGQLSLDAQSRAIAPSHGPVGKVVLATAIAESSLTIAGVRLVIDSGLSRVSRYDPARGMDGLVTVPASQASAAQRAGRAGRLGPGACLRLWSPAEQLRRPPFDTPELLRTDPLPLALQLAEWGAGLGEGLPWLSAPPRAALLDARLLLQQLGALDGDGRINGHGRRMAALGLHPRLAHMLLSSRPGSERALALDLAVLLSERDPLERERAGSDLSARLDWLRNPGGGRRSHTHRQLRTQLQRQLVAVEPRTLSSSGSGATSEANAASLAEWVAMAYPERVALARGQGDGRFLMRNGRGARVHPRDPLATAPALAIASADGQGVEARVELAAALDPHWLRQRAIGEGETHTSLSWEDGSGRVRAQRQRRLGALVIESQPWLEAPAEAVRAVLIEGLRLRGLEALPWTAASRQLQRRLTLAHGLLGSPWPDRRPQTLLASLEDWLGPHLAGHRSLEEVQRLDLIEALWGDLGWNHRQELEALLPATVTVPSGRAVAIDYGDGEAVVAVKLQEMFGCAATPRLLHGSLPLTVHLLSPAGRPLAITQDLEAFWRGAYREVRREMRGRYPRHPWPEDPSSALPTARTKRQLEDGQRPQESSKR